MLLCAEAIAAFLNSIFMERSAPRERGSLKWKGSTLFRRRRRCTVCMGRTAVFRNTDRDRFAGPTIGVR